MSAAVQTPTLGAVLRRLQKVRKTGERQWTACCPAHEDRDPSLSVGEGADGRVLLTCHAGCDYEAIVAALGLENIHRTTNPLALENASRVYDYTDERGTVLYKNARYVPKSFRPWSPDGHGGWVMSLPKSVARVPYHLPLLRAARPDEPVLVVEGEKDVECAEAAGFVATTTIGGAKSFGASATALARQLTRRRVVIVPDSDDPGDRYTQDALQALRPVAAVVAVLRLPGLPHTSEHGEDLSDWLGHRGHTAEELRQFVDAALAEAPSSVPRASQSAPQTDSVKDWQPTIQTASELMDKELPPVRWVVQDIIAEGVTLLGGKAKKGKSTLMLHIAMSVVQGAKALGKLTTERADVLYLALEDNERRMQRRIRAMLGMGEKVPAGLHIAYQWLPLDMGGSAALERYLKAHPNTHLVIVDTLHHVRTPPRGGGNGYAEDYEACKELLRIAGERQIAIVVLTHLRKAPAEDPFDEFNATGGLLAGVDNALVMRPAGRDGLMEMHRRGREFEDDSTLALCGNKQTLRWTFAGQAEAVMRSAERKAVIDALPPKGSSERMNPKDIADALDKPVGTIRKLLFSLMREAQPAIAKDLKGGYYSLGEDDTATAGDGNGPEAEESAQEADVQTLGPVTDSVTALPPSSSGGNGRSAHVERPQWQSVTSVTGVTTGDVDDDDDSEEMEEHL